MSAVKVIVERTVVDVDGTAAAVVEALKDVRPDAVIIDVDKRTYVERLGQPPRVSWRLTLELAISGEGFA